VSGNLWEQLERVLTKTLKPELALTLLVNLGEQPESVAQLAATMRSSCMECISNDANRVAFQPLLAILDGMPSEGAGDCWLLYSRE
jgi:hypothetical protein